MTNPQVATLPIIGILLLAACSPLTPQATQAVDALGTASQPYQPSTPTLRTIGPTPITDLSVPAPTVPSLEGILAFASTRNGVNGIFTMDLASQRVEPFITDADHTTTAPTWSPDGTELAFASNIHRDIHGALDIFTIGANGKNRRRLVASSSDASHPTWSPSGTQLAFDVGSPFGSRIKVVSSTGDFLFAITGGTFSGRPSWSPTGEEIVFLCGDDYSTLSICIYSLSAQTVRTIPQVSAGPDGVAWAPTADEVAYTDAIDCKIHIIDTSTFKDSPLTSGPGCDTAPAWSPDGKNLAFHSDRSDPLGDIYITSIGGNGAFAVVENPGYDAHPAWDPAR